MTATNLNVELAALQLGSKLFDTLCHSLKILLKITKWTGCNWSNDDWCGDISVLELHPKLELLKLSGFGKTVILSVFIVARIWLWPDSRHLKLLSSPRCCLCFPLIPPPWRNAPRLWRVHYWSPPSTGWYTLTHTHTHLQSRLSWQGVQCWYMEEIMTEQKDSERKLSPLEATLGELTPYSTRSGTSQFRFCRSWSMSLYVALPFTIL